MESKTERILRAAGTREGFAVLRALLEAEMTTAGLAFKTRLSTSTLERTLETLSQGSLVSRRPGTQGSWFVVQWPETLALLDAARLLGVAIQGSEDHLDGVERALFERLQQAGGSAPAARRGRRPSSE
jgi:DNA-binding IscR family transcriptional regulator